MNHLETVKKLQNRYILQRHGFSSANDQGIIISNPEFGRIAFGLTLGGRIGARFKVQKAKQDGLFTGRPTVIISSDFKRTLETAEEDKKVLGDVEIIPEPRLRERRFGMFEGRRNHHYQHVWDEDKKDSGHTKWAVESVDQVIERTTQLIMDIEKIYTGFNVILVAHGDVLQILDTAFNRLSGSEHPSLDHLNTGEMREAVLRRRSVKQWMRAKRRQLTEGMHQLRV